LFLLLGVTMGELSCLAESFEKRTSYLPGTTEKAAVCAQAVLDYGEPTDRKEVFLPLEGHSDGCPRSASGRCSSRLLGVKPVSLWGANIPSVSGASTR